MILRRSTSASTRSHTMSAHTNGHCEALRDRAAADPSQRLSVHHTSEGHVLYYRCYCGRPAVTLIRPPARA
jgi:hypothetical protein